MSYQQLLGKLHRLKEQTVSAPDYLSLDKCNAKLQKMRPKISEYRNHRDLTEITEMIDQLVREKTKFFKQKMLGNSSRKISKNSSESQSKIIQQLKGSKSVENLTIPFSPNNQNSRTVIKLSSANRHPSEKDKLKRKSKNPLEFTRKFQNQDSRKFIYDEGDQNQFEAERTSFDEKTQNNQRNFKKNNEDKQIISMMENKLSQSMRQIDNLTSKIADMEMQNKIATMIKNNNKIKTESEIQSYNSLKMANNFTAKRDNVIEEYNKRLREKNFMIEDLKGKNQYLKSMNDELKSRVLGEKRRNQDYIEDLRAEVKNLKKQCEKYKTQVENLTNQIDDLEQNNAKLTQQIKKLSQKLIAEGKQKQKMRKNITQSASIKTKELEKQISHLSLQASNLGKLEITLQDQVAHKEQLQVFSKKLQTQVDELEKSLQKISDEKEKLQEAAYEFLQQNKKMKQEIKILENDRQVLAQQILSLRQKNIQQIKIAQRLQYEKDLQQKNKLYKLKEIKSLLTQLH